MEKLQLFHFQPLISQEIHFPYKPLHMDQWEHIPPIIPSYKGTGPSTYEESKINVAA
eukprot:c17517_g1_i3 orf=861-1031(+)